jgi:hypothetical protein
MVASASRAPNLHTLAADVSMETTIQSADFAAGFLRPLLQ